MKRPACALTLLALCLWSATAQEPKKDADPLALDSQWKGKLTQRGKIMGQPVPPEFDVVLVVTKRKDKDFDCELREKLAEGSFVTYACKGVITPDKDGAFKVNFVSVAVKAASDGFVPVPVVTYTGTINGNALKGTWKYPLNKKEDTELEGDFSVEKQQLSKEIN